MNKYPAAGLKWVAATLVVLAAATIVWAFATLEFDASVEGTAQQIRDWGMWGVAGSIGLCYLAPLWCHLNRGLMEPLKSRANGTTRIAA